MNGESKSLSPSQREAFKQQGVIKLAGYLPTDLVSRARQVTLSGLQEIRNEDGWHIDKLAQLPPHKANSMLAKSLGRSAGFQARIPE